MEKKDFIKRVSDSLMQNNPLGFHKAVSSRLKELFKQKMSQLKEDTADPEMEAVTRIENAAKSFGGASVYENGVLIVTLRGKQGAMGFSDWLEGCDFVDGYEVEIVSKSPLDKFSKQGKIDIDITTDEQTFEFTVYLSSDLIQFEFDYEDQEIGESAGEDDEKMKCQRGFLWNSESNSCEKISESKLAVIRKAVRESLLKKKSKGKVFRARVIKKN
jgi:hypothetical protein